MNYLEKLYRAVILDSELYEEVEADKNLTRQALMTVALVAIIEGIFSFGAPSFSASDLHSKFFFG